MNENKLDVIQKSIPLKTSTESHYEDDLLKLNTKSSITIPNCEIINNSQIYVYIITISSNYAITKTKIGSVKFDTTYTLSTL